MRTARGAMKVRWEEFAWVHRMWARQEQNPGEC